MSQPVLRAAGPEDDEAIAACIGAAFPGNPKADLDVLRWQYRANPFGETASWVWDAGGEVVAHYSAFPMPYLLDGRSATGANAVDAAVVPSHQGRKLFTPLARALYDDCAARGMPVAVCYARNPVAMRGVAKAGVEWQPRLRTLVAPAFGRGGLEVDAPPATVEALWRRAVERDGIANGVDRGAAWWRWRYADAPRGAYRFVAVGDRAAAVVLPRREHGLRVGYVLELLAADGVAARAALRGAGRGLQALVTLAVDGGPLHRLARAAGMRTVPRRLEPKGAWYGVVDTTGADPGRPSAPWHVGWGDMDHL